MGQSTDGQISYGIKFDDDYEFPWDIEDDRWDSGDIEDWWLRQTGWKWDGEEPFTPEGDFAPGFSRYDPRIDAYFSSRQAWKKAHPLPVELVNYQSGDYPAWLLCVPGSTITARRGDPVEIDGDEPLALRITADDRDALFEFCRKYGLEGEGEPCWWLSGYWG